MENGSGSPTERSRLVLLALARTLGCAPEVFFGAAGFERLTDAEELLHLWLAIEDPSARRRVLDCARAVKDHQDARMVR